MKQWTIYKNDSDLSMVGRRPIKFTKEDYSWNEKANNFSIKYHRNYHQLIINKILRFIKMIKHSNTTFSIEKRISKRWISYRSNE